MRILSKQTHIDFLGYRKTAVVFSVALILGSLLSLVVHGGPNYGIDFEGGSLVQVAFNDAADVPKIRKALSESNIRDFSVQTFGEPEDILINLGKSSGESEDDEANSKLAQAALKEKFGDTFVIERVEMVGPKVGADLRQKALLALLYSLAGILIYITLRFELRFGLAAVVALAHDTAITVGAFSVMDKEFTLPVIAALLTVIGYSLNDTIVVFDRIRENMKLKRGVALPDLLNLSINQTLSRTLLTSGTTMTVVLAIFFLGGEVIHDFSFALLVGVIIGTYSSIFVASPILLLLDKNKKKTTINSKTPAKA